MSDSQLIHDLEVEVFASDRFSRQIQRIYKSLPTADFTTRAAQGRQLAQKVTYLGSPLHYLEGDSQHTMVTLRSEVVDKTADIRYYEIKLGAEGFSLTHYQYQRETGERQLTPFIMTEENLAQLSQDLMGVIA